MLDAKLDCTSNGGSFEGKSSSKEGVSAEIVAFSPYSVSICYWCLLLNPCWLFNWWYCMQNVILHLTEHIKILKYVHKCISARDTSAIWPKSYYFAPNPLFAAWLSLETITIRCRIKLCIEYYQLESQHNSKSEYREAILAEMRQNPSIFHKLTFFVRWLPVRLLSLDEELNSRSYKMY